MRDRRRRSLRTGDIVFYTVYRWDVDVAAFVPVDRDAQVISRDRLWVRLFTEHDGGKIMTLPARELKAAVA